MPRTILDVSRWQGSINWDKVKASGKIDGVMLRVLGSKDGKPYVDPAFERNYAACTARGIPVGGYYYTCAVTQRQTEEELAALKTAPRGENRHVSLSQKLDAACQIIQRLRIGAKVLKERFQRNRIVTKHGLCLPDHCGTLLQHLLVR
jgi:hypothetical protein